jgi:hypothetical protein
MTDLQREQFNANRAKIKSCLIGEGMAAELAERWLAVWEASSNMDVERFRLDFWERGGHWASTAWAAGQQPPSIEQ